MSRFQNLSFLPIAVAFVLALGACATIAPAPEDQALVEARAKTDEAGVREAFEAERIAQISARNSEVEAELQARLPDSAALAREQMRLQSKMLELIERYQTAGPVERTKLETRAHGLAEEAKALDRAARW